MQWPTMKLNPWPLCALLAASAWAQQEAPPANPAAEAAPPGQEVEVSEDNYRRYMELKDQQIERAPLPVDSYQPRSGLEKMERLPEASQKHLRNQLREIIVQGDAWQPEDADTLYPYVPSAAAQSDGALQRQEGEAWEELVGEYHAREAAIYAAAQGRPAPDGGTASPAGMPQPAAGMPQAQASAGAPQTATPDGPQSAPGQTGNPQQPGASEASAGSSASTTTSAAMTAPMIEASDPSVPASEVTQEGVTENALLYLTRKCKDPDRERPDTDCPEDSEKD